MNADEPVVVTDRLTKKYGDLLALDGLSFSLGRGQILGLIGPNGAGKTTAINILVGLVRPTSGSARIAGADCLRESRKIKRLVGCMPDRFGAYENMRVREYLDFFGAAFGIPRKARAARIAEVLELTHATWMQDRFVESLSHGMQQRVGLARTLLHDPQVLILDEPANGLDPEARIEMRGILLRLARAGKTLIVTSHVLPELSRICDLVAILTKGRLRAFGTLDEIMRRVSQERTIEVQLAGPDGAGQAADEIRRLAPDANDVAVSPAEAMVRFRSALPDRALGEVLAGLVRAGVEVTQFRELQSDLEDAFLSVTRDDGADAADASPTANTARAGGRS
ncbi:MAG: ABC transporter ATP-binding protein [Thermoguttaceae bacterium]|jgi:ABC-2 type transport system ATP-binding protein|nr:ABC transporter ATP-binding protein [Thermoguttaceae bacterium]